MLFKHEDGISPLALVRVGSKREWVPMWLWMIVFRLGLYEIQPFGWLTYRRAE